MIGQILEFRLFWDDPAQLVVALDDAYPTAGSGKYVFLDDGRRATIPWHLLRGPSQELTAHQKARAAAIVRDVVMDPLDPCS